MRASSRFCRRRLDPVAAFCITTSVRVTNPRITVITEHTTTSLDERHAGLGPGTREPFVEPPHE